MSDDKDLDEILTKYQNYFWNRDVRDGMFGETLSHKEAKQALDRHYYQKFLDIIGDGKNDSPHNYNAHREREILRIELRHQAKLKLLRSE